MKSTLGVFLAVALVAISGCGGVPATAPGAAVLQEPGRHDVIVVGAGMAGLTAAKQLLTANRTVLLLEASDRIGGRAFSDTKTFRVPVDYGAAWIHGIEANPLTEIVDGLGFHRVDTDLEGPIFVGDRPATEAEQLACAQTSDALDEALEAAAEDGRDPPVSSLLPSGAPCRDLAGDNVGRFESGVELAESSTLDAALFESENDDFVREGMGTFVTAYGRDVPVRLRSVVTSVRYGPDGVVVELESGERYEGLRALVTVSTGVLRAQKIAFDPPLPEWKLRAIDGLPMGLLNKVVMEFRSDLFTSTPSNSWVLWDGPANDNVAFVIKPLGAAMAVAFYGGSQATAFENDDVAALDEAKSALRSMYGPRVDTELSRSKITHWGKNPFTLGSYSAARPGAQKMRAVLALPVADRVFFAGEACARPALNGSIAGAYETGVIASGAIDKSLAKKDDGPKR
jgi:monoamine oxidase